MIVLFRRESLGNGRVQASGDACGTVTSAIRDPRDIAGTEAA
jgi:hypothetical protein